MKPDGGDASGQVRPSLDEVIRGVSPLRHHLGAAVLAVQVVALLNESPTRRHGPPNLVAVGRPTNAESDGSPESRPWPAGLLQPG